MPENQRRQLAEAETGSFDRKAPPPPPNFVNRQLVEGYAATVSQPGIAPNFGRGLPQPVADFRGPNGVAATREWWRPRPDDELDLVWQTAPPPAARDTTFTFAGASANLPADLFPPHQATLSVDDSPVISFDLGLRERRIWTDGDWALEFVPKQLRTDIDGYHRQFEAGGCAGIYRLAAPVSALTPGRPLQLKVVLESPRTTAPHWFALLERTDVLDVTLETNAEQIEQLQQENIRLKQIVGNLARRVYPELFPDLLSTEEVIIYTNGWAHAHPPDVERLHNGDLLVCFREASEHLSADGKIVTVRSSDGGQTWGDRQVVRAHPDTDEREASIAQLRNGTLLMNQWVNAYYDGVGRYVSQPTSTNRGRPHGNYFATSSDDGHSWTWLSDQPLDPAPFPSIASSERVIELPSGQLLLAVYFHFVPLDQPRRGCALYRSGDGGASWRYLSTMGDVPGIALGEPALVRTASGRLICLMRNETASGFYQAHSDDDGQTWSPAVPSGIPGRANPASLLSLPDGTVLCIYASRHDVKGMYVVASYDDGATWDLANRKVIRHDLPNWDIGYPSSVLMPDGRILAVYYFNMFERYFIAGSFFHWQRD